MTAALEKYAQYSAVVLQTVQCWRHMKLTGQRPHPKTLTHQWQLVALLQHLHLSAVMSSNSYQVQLVNYQYYQRYHQQKCAMRPHYYLQHATELEICRLYFIQQTNDTYTVQFVDLHILILNVAYCIFLGVPNRLFYGCLFLSNSQLNLNSTLVQTLMKLVNFLLQNSLLFPFHTNFFCGFWFLTRQANVLHL